MFRACHDLVHDAVHEFLHLDGKIFATAHRLFLEPGELTDEHILGRRIRDIGALRRRNYPRFLYFATHATAGLKACTTTASETDVRRSG